MPELPEVETIARGLAPDVVGRTILGVQVLDPSALQPNPEAFQAIAVGRTIARVGRRGKLLLLYLASPNHNDHNADHNHSASSSSAHAMLAIHLRMTGRVMAYGPGQTPAQMSPRPRAILNLSGGVALSFADVRRFGSMHAFAPGEIDLWPFYRDLGPEPLTLATAEFRKRLTGSRSRIKALMLDQHIIAGIGNIYADEALFRASIRPTTPASSLAAHQLDALHQAIQAVLAQAIAENGSSIRDYRTAHGDAGAFQNHFQAYGRAGQPCTRCQTIMVSSKVAGRTSTYCEQCQR